MPTKKPLVLVTGANGFIGRALVPYLQANGYRIRTASHRQSAPADPALNAIEAVVLPAPDAPISDFEKLVEGCDHVVHLAAIAHAKRELPADLYDAVNRLLAEKLGLAAKTHTPGKFIFMSSVGAQTGSVRNNILRETDEPAPDKDYGRAKLAAEAAIRALYGSDTRYTVLRPVLVYGPGVGGNMATLIKLARLPLPLPFAGLTAQRSLLDRQALCEAVLHCLRSPRTDGGTYLVADQTPLSVADIVAAIRAGFGRHPRLFYVSQGLLDKAARLAGQEKRWLAVSGPLVVSPLLLEATGWQPPHDTMRRLAQSVAPHASDEA